MNSLNFRFTAVLLFTVALLTQACNDNNNRFSINFNDAPEAYDTSTAIRDTVVAGGVQLYVYEEGSGDFEVVSRDRIAVRITARDENGRVIDSSFNNQSASTIRVLPNLTPTPSAGGGFRGPELLVEGLRRGLIGLREGGRYTFVIPPELAFNEEYAARAGRTSPRLTPRLDLSGQTITYDIELIAILQ